MALRILHIAPYGPEAWAYGGIPRVVGAMTQGLRQRGHQVTLCTTDAHDARTRLPRTAPGHGAERVVLPNVSNRAAYHLQAFAPVGLRRFLDTQVSSFDVAHLHACHNVLGILASRALARARIPYVLSPNGTAPVFERRQLAKRALQRLGGADVLARASRVLAVSEAEARQLRLLGVAPARVSHVPNPVDLREFEVQPDGARFRLTHKLDNRPVVLFLGKITPRKGVGTVVDAFARLGSSRAQLVLAGNDMGGLSEAVP
ncbi:MAG: glycosyltransferase, partial [Vicinamibacterales bacterium]